MKVFWVSKHLAFGSALSSWEDVRRLHAIGLTHVINLRSSRRYRTKLRSFHRLWLPFPDDKEPRPARFYRDALRFYRRAIEGSDSKVFVNVPSGNLPQCVPDLLPAAGLRLHAQASRKERKERKAMRRSLPGLPGMRRGLPKTTPGTGAQNLAANPNQGAAT